MLTAAEVAAPLRLSSSLDLVYEDSPDNRTKKKRISPQRGWRKVSFLHLLPPQTVFMGTVRKEETITAAEALAFLTLLLSFDNGSRLRRLPRLIMEYHHKEYIKEHARVSETWFRSIMENLRKSIRTEKGHRNYFLDLIQYRPFIHFTHWIHKTIPGEQEEIEADVAWKIRNGHCFSRNINWEDFCKEWKEPRHAQGINDEEREEKKPKEAMNGVMEVQKETVEGKKKPEIEKQRTDGDKTVKLENTTGGKEETTGKKEPKTEPVDKELNNSAMTGKHTNNKETAGSQGKKNLKEEKEATEESMENKKRTEDKRKTIPKEEKDAREQERRQGWKGCVPRRGEASHGE